MPPSAAAPAGALTEQCDVLEYFEAREQWVTVRDTSSAGGAGGAPLPPSPISPPTPPSASSPPPPSLPEGGLTVMTLNVWFDRSHQRARFDAVLALVEAERPDVVALQEMTATTAGWLTESPTIRSRYYITDPAVVTRCTWYGLITLVTKRLCGPPPTASYTPYPTTHTKLGRGLLHVTLPAARVAVGNTHLESPVPGATAAHRAAQLELCPMLMRGGGGGGGGCFVQPIVVGDFNFESAAEDEAIPAAGLADCWRLCHAAHTGDDDGLTFDSKHNLNLAGRDYRKRPDRITCAVCPSPGAGAGGLPVAGWVQPSTIRRVADQPLSPALAAGANAPRCHPSDHFGLLCRFVRCPPAAAPAPAPL